ncbi:MAG: hypothetical protein ACREYE_13160 [Gammaproteobacteria bacterium]
MRDYPYVCWEQILSRGVMAAHYQGLKGYLPPSFEWKGSEALPKDMFARGEFSGAQWRHELLDPAG